MTKIIDDAIKCKASDIHIYPHISGNSFIKLRINGNLSKYESYTNRELDAINSLLKNEKPRILLIDSGKTQRYWAVVSDVKKEIPQDGIYPDYYKKDIDNFTIWFKVTEIQPAPSDILSRCTVASSGAILSFASKRSMSSFFMINAEEESICVRK